MNVGLFGDSFACLTLGKGAAWFESNTILEKYNLINYAKKGSDITWSYKLFLEHHHKYEKNIFIVTESTRHSFTVGPHIIHASNLDAINEIQNNVRDHKIIKILNSLKDHYMHTMSFDLYDFGLVGMVDHIKKIRPNTIIVYGFLNSKITETNFCLHNVSLMELLQFSIDFENMKRTGLGEGRSAHLTDENNKVFADYIRNRLDGKEVSISIDDFYIPPASDIKKYFPDY